MSRRSEEKVVDKWLSGCLQVPNHRYSSFLPSWSLSWSWPWHGSGHQVLAGATSSILIGITTTTNTIFIMVMVIILVTIMVVVMVLVIILILAGFREQQLERARNWPEEKPEEEVGAFTSSVTINIIFFSITTITIIIIFSSSTPSSLHTI